MLTSYSKISPFYKTRAATAKKISNNAIAGTENALFASVAVARMPAPNAEPNAFVGQLRRNNESENMAFVTQEEGEVEVSPDDTHYNCTEELDERDEENGTAVRPNFLNEPYKEKDIILSEDSITKLNGDNWLTTELLDFLIKHSCPFWLPSDVAIPTTNVERLLDELNAKASSNDPDDMEYVKTKRNEYKYFATKQFRIYTFSVQKGHYFLLEMIFDGADSDGDFFQYITVYDSLLRRERNNAKTNIKKKPLKNDTALQLLKKYQTFCYNYILHDKEESLLSKFKDSIFNEVTYVESPMIKVPYDSGLFAFVIFLHLLRGFRITPDVFTQGDVTAFRNGLKIVVNGPKEELNCDPKSFIPVEFIYSYVLE